MSKIIKNDFIVDEEENYVVFFSYRSNDNLIESMAIVKAINNIYAQEQFKKLTTKRKYEELHIWWIEELEKMYGRQEIIIP